MLKVCVFGLGAVFSTDASTGKNDPGHGKDCGPPRDYYYSVGFGLLSQEKTFTCVVLHLTIIGNVKGFTELFSVRCAVVINLKKSKRFGLNFSFWDPPS